MNASIFLRAHLSSCLSALGKAAALQKDGHAGLRGNLREILVKAILRPILPPEVQIGTGQLVDIEGTLSPQIDVVLYAPSVMMPALFDDKAGFFPVESALYTIEVKSRLTKAELKASVSNALATRRLKLVPTRHVAPSFDDQIVKERKFGTPQAVSALFAYGSSLGSDPKRELERYRSCDENADTRPAISVICIVGRGYWYHGTSGWKFCAAAAESIPEVMSWLAGTANTVPGLIVAKGRPQFGLYLSDHKIEDVE